MAAPGRGAACGEGRAVSRPGTACPGQVLSAWLAQEPSRKGLLAAGTALFAHPILFPCPGSGQADAAQAARSQPGRAPSRVL